MTQWQPIQSHGTNPDGSKYHYHWLSFSCKPGRVFWPNPDISITDEEPLDEEYGTSLAVSEDCSQRKYVYKRDELLKLRLSPLSLMRPLNLPAVKCVKAYHRE